MIEEDGGKIGPTRLSDSTYSTRDAKSRFTSGNFAVVVPAERDDGTKVALRFFLGKVPSHTTQIISHITNHPQIRGLVGCKMLRKLLPLKDGTEVDAMEMDFIEGSNLDDVVDSYITTGKAGDLTGIADHMFENVMELLETGFLHGDLSHGNVMIETATGAVRFVDYDSAVINSMDSKNLVGTLEEGHPNYHHPSRRGRELLTCDVLFSALVIHVSLISLSRDPSLWAKFNKHVDGLLFRSANDDLRSADTNLWMSIKPLFINPGTGERDPYLEPMQILEKCVRTKDLRNASIESELETWWSVHTPGPNPVPAPIPDPNPNPNPNPVPPSPVPRPIHPRTEPKPSPVPRPKE
ncbi:uncharacterized protein METZ01_LOCUS302683, partial [marine metagenome]